MRRLRVAGLAAVVGPGLLAGLSDDDPAGITTYSVIGADHGYTLLWVLLASTVALVLFHELGARLGVVTGQGLTGLVRERFGVRWTVLLLASLIVANLGTTSAEFAGVAAALQPLGVGRLVSVPLAAAGVAFLVLRGSFHRVEHVLLALATVFAAYVAAGVLAHPDWEAAAEGLAVPRIPGTRTALLAITATVGTTLAPWGLSFIQSYTVDKRLTIDQLRPMRVEVVTGAVMTGVIGFFVVVASAATLHADGRSIRDAGDAAEALAPLAGNAAAWLFGAGLLGAALLAASILPLATAYSVAEALGLESTLDDAYAEARVFYWTYGIIVVIAAGVVLIPGVPLVKVLYLSQALNAVLLIPLMVFTFRMGRDDGLMGEHVTGRAASAAQVAALVAVAASVGGLAILQIS